MEKTAKNIKKAEKIVSVSKNRIDHVFNNHTLESYLAQYGKRPDASLKILIESKSFFNPKWSKDKIEKAINHVYDEALKKGITKGNYTSTYAGEKVTVFMEQGANLRTAYGNYRYNYKEFVKIAKSRRK